MATVTMADFPCSLDWTRQALACRVTRHETVTGITSARWPLLHQPAISSPSLDPYFTAWIVNCYVFREDQTFEAQM